MSIRLFLCVPLLLQAFSCCYSQGFVREYGDAGINEGGNSLVTSPDGNLFLGGYQGDKALVMKIDPNGNILWSKSIQADAGYTNYVTQLSITPDGYLIGCGNSNSSGIPYNTFYFKMDLSGNMQWVKHSNTSGIGLYSKAILTAPDGSYSLIGGAYALGSAADPVQRGVSATTGSQTWTGPRYEYVPTNPYIDETYSAIPSPTGGIFTTGRIYVDGGPSTMRPYISKFNNAGQEQWTKFYVSDPNSSARVYGIDIISDNDSLTLTYFGDIVTYSSNYKVGIIHTDTLGVFTWGKNYQIQEYGSALSFKILPMPYGYVLSGYGQGQSLDELFLIGVNHNGNVLWAKGYGNPGVNSDIYFSASRNATTMNGDIYFTGRSGTGSSTDAVLYRVDQNGNISCGFSHDLTIITSDVPPYTDYLYPTPSTDNAVFSNVNSYTSTIISNQCTDPGDFLGNDTSLCSTIVLQAPSLGTGTTYLWQDGSTGANYSANTPGQYWAQVTGNCCTFTDTLNILPGTGPQASFSVAALPCSLTINTTNSSTNANSFLWNFGDGYTNSSITPSHTFATGGSFSISLMATNGCGTDDTTITTTVQLPQGSFTVSGPDTLCPNVPGTFAGTLSNAVLSSILWSNGMQGPSISFSASASTYVQATAIDSNTCTYTDSIYISILNNPTAAFTFNALACDTEVTFINQSTNTTGLSWNLGNGEQSSASSPHGHYPLFGTYEITLIASNTCGQDSVMHTFSSGPMDSAIVTGPSALCQAEFGVYNVVLANGTGITDVTWSNGPSDSSSISLAFVNDGVVSATVLGNDGCMYSSTAIVQVSPPPIASFTFTYNPCDSSAIFYNGSIDADSINWSFGNGTSSQLEIPTTQFLPDSSYTMSLFAFNSCGVDTTQQVVATLPVPVLAILGPDVICSNDPVTLHSSITTGNLHNVQWSTGDTTLSINVVPDNGLIVSLTAVSSEGCTLSVSDTIERIGDGETTSIYIPNVFTPNNDGINDWFMPVIAKGFLSLEIFNRWGQEIFSSTEKQNQWLGTFKNKQVPDGTYVYIVHWFDQCAGFAKSRIGHVTLLR